MIFGNIREKLRLNSFESLSLILNSYDYKLQVINKLVLENKPTYGQVLCLHPSQLQTVQTQPLRCSQSTLSLQSNSSSSASLPSQHLQQITTKAKH